MTNGTRKQKGPFKPYSPTHHGRACPGHHHKLHGQEHAVAEPRHDEVEMAIGCGYGKGDCRERQIQCQRDNCQMIAVLVPNTFSAEQLIQDLFFIKKFFSI
jgi:hypothetical protein